MLALRQLFPKLLSSSATQEEMQRFSRVNVPTRNLRPAFKHSQARGASGKDTRRAITMPLLTGENSHGHGIRQIIKGHTPKFALAFGARMTHQQKLMEGVSNSTR